MIVNYNFDKKIKKNGSSFFLEINISKKFNNFIYKIYGDHGFFQYGKYSSYKNNDENNILVFNIDKIQLIFISIELYKKNTEYFDFINMENIINNNNVKNIIIDIKKKYNKPNFLDLEDNNSDEENNPSENESLSSDDEDTNELENKSLSSDNEDANVDANELENKSLNSDNVDANELENKSLNSDDEDDNKLENINII